MARLRVAMGELKLNIRQAENGPAIPVRFVISNVTGVVLNVHAYKEVKNEKRQDIFVSGSSCSHIRSGRPLGPRLTVALAGRVGIQT